MQHNVVDDNIVPSLLRTYGHDINYLFDSVFDTPTNPDEIQTKFEQCAMFIDQENFPEAKRLLAQLESELDSDNADLTHLRGLIEFLDEGEEDTVPL